MVDSLESIAEVFKCFICMEKLQDARLCPHCSKLCCATCIRRWLSEHRHCPHCRVSLHLHELVICRWAQEVTQGLDLLQLNIPRPREAREQRREDRCPAHNEKLSVYCSNCEQCICPQCALFDQTHVQHTFRQLDDVHHSHKQQIQLDIDALQRRLAELTCLLNDLEKNVDSVKSAKDERMRETRNVVEMIMAKLEAQLKSKLHYLTEQRRLLTQEKEHVQNTKVQLEQELRNASKVELIRKSLVLRNQSQEVLIQPMRSFVQVSAEFVSELVPQYDSSTFEMTQFSVLQQRADPVYSPPMKVNGMAWRLKIYPDGNGVVRGAYLSVFLELSNGLQEKSKYEYRVEMIHLASKDPSRSIVREFASDFEEGECWGYNRFYRLDLLASEGYLDADNDVLMFRFQVRPQTYFQKCRDQQWYIQQLEAHNRRQNSILGRLKAKLQLERSRRRLTEERLPSETDGIAAEGDGTSSPCQRKMEAERGRVLMMEMEVEAGFSNHGDDEIEGANAGSSCDSSADSQSDASGASDNGVVEISQHPLEQGADYEECEDHDNNEGQEELNNTSLMSPTPGCVPTTCVERHFPPVSPLGMLASVTLSDAEEDDEETSPSDHNNKNAAAAAAAAAASRRPNWSFSPDLQEICRELHFLRNQGETPGSPPSPPPPPPNTTPPPNGNKLQVLVSQTPLSPFDSETDSVLQPASDDSAIISASSAEAMGNRFQSPIRRRNSLPHINLHSPRAGDDASERKEDSI